MSELLTTPLDYADVNVWTDKELYAHAHHMMSDELAEAVPRKRAELERKVNHVIFELSCRNLDMKLYEGEMVDSQLAV